MLGNAVTEPGMSRDHSHDSYCVSCVALRITPRRMQPQQVACRASECLRIPSRPSNSGTGPVHDTEARLRDRMIRNQADTTGTGRREQFRTQKMWRALACPTAVSEGHRRSSASTGRRSSPFLMGGISNDWGCWPSVERRRRAENCRRSLQDEAGHARLGWVAALGCS